MLVGAGELLGWLCRMRGKGLKAEQARIDWPALMRFSEPSRTRCQNRAKRDSPPRASSRFTVARVFVGPNTVSVGTDALEGRHIAVATRARPVPLGISGEELTTILHRGKRPLERFDPDLVARLLEHTRSLGIVVQLDSRRGDRRRPGPLGGAIGSTPLRDGDGGACRRAHAGPAAGVEREKRGVRVNEFLQSVSNPIVYAAGDAAAGGGAPLTPVAGYQARIVASNLLEGNLHKPNYAGMASAVYTVPPLSTESALLGVQAAEHINSFRSGRAPGSSRRRSEGYAFRLPYARLGLAVHALI